MKQQDWNNAVMNCIDPALVEQAAAPQAKKRAVRPVRIAVAAACLCAVLVGGAFAAETVFGIPIFKPIDTSPVDGTPANGFTTVIELPEESEQPDGTTVNPLLDPDINGVFKVWEKVYSQELRDYAASLKAYTVGTKNFNSWDAAEKFIGIDLMNNPVLESGAAGLLFYSDDPNALKTQTPCRVSVTAVDGILTSAKAEAAYRVNYKDTTDGYGATVHIYLTVQSYTKHSLIADDQMFLALGFPEGYTFVTESYTTPSGLTASIVEVREADGSVYGYVAQFALNRNAVTVQATYIPDPAHALSTLKAVLDAFE